MNSIKIAITGISLALAASAALSAPAIADGGPSGAEKLRRLDVMLAVSGERCGNQGDYRRFAASQGAELSRATAELLAGGHAHGGQRALNRINASTADAYGRGHPWLNCAQLGLAMRNLSLVQGRATLEEAADQLMTAKTAPRQAATPR